MIEEPRARLRARLLRNRAKELPVAEVSVKKAIDAPASAVWELVADFADISWMPVGTRATVEGEGVGMARVIAAGDGIREVLESRDAAARTLVYTIPENVPFPVENYRSTMIVSESGAGSELEWRGSFEPDGVPEEHACAQVEQMYGVMIGWIADAVTKS